MPVECLAEKDLTPQVALEILELQHAAFEGTPEFATQRWWHTPPADDELWFFTRQGGRMVGSVRVVHRSISVEGRNFRVAGIANVCSHPDARGSGAAKACLQAVGDYIETAGQLDFGMLFCSPQNASYYAKTGWLVVENFIAMLDEKGERFVTDPKVKGKTMIHPGRLPPAQWPTGLVDLNGRDW